MKHSLFLIIHLSFLVFVTQNVIGQNDFFVINYEKSLLDKKNIALSEIASKVEYVQLETNPDCLLNTKARFFFTDSIIFVDNHDNILKFSITGKFLKKIGTTGRGPGEISKIADLSIIPEKRQIVIQLLGRRSLLYYSFDGKFIKSANSPYRGIVKTMIDGNILVWDGGPLIYAKLTFLLTNEKRDTLSVIPNYLSLKNTAKIVVAPGIPFFPERFYYCNNIFYFRDDYNDTVYTVNSNKIEPYCLIKLGKYKLPKELLPENLGPENMDSYTKEAPKYYFCTSFEIMNKVYVTSHSYSKNVPKLVLFDKSLNQGNLLINTNGTSTGFVNDWDNGLDFWPIGSMSYNKVYMPIDIKTLQSKFDKNNQNQTVIKYPENQKQLEKLVHDSDVLDNPVLMVVTLK